MSADGPNSTSDFELQLQLLSGASGGGVNSFSLQSLLLLFSTPRAKMSSFIICVAPLATSMLPLRFFSLAQPTFSYSTSLLRAGAALL